MGDPSYVNPQPHGPGHIVCLTWDSAIPKFGIDRGAGVWNDYGNPDHFRFWFGFGDINQGIAHTWKGQHLHDGLPVITTVFEQDGVRYTVEQFAYPLDGPPEERRGDIEMVLMQQVRVTNLEQARARGARDLQPQAAAALVYPFAGLYQTDRRRGSVLRACAAGACCSR